MVNIFVSFTIKYLYKHNIENKKDLSEKKGLNQIITQPIETTL